MSSRNSTNHYEVSNSEGFLFSEKSRNSFGGYVNMIDRVAARFSCKLRPVETNGEVSATFQGGDWVRNEQGGRTWQANDVLVSFNLVNKL